MSNSDLATVHGFGYEWSNFDQSRVSSVELQKLFGEYFSVFPWHEVDMASSIGADFGCGSGRWSKFVAPRVKILHLIDASAEALDVARRNLLGNSNVVFHEASVEDAMIEDNSLDFAFSLGVLHHVPDTARALRDIQKKMKLGSPLLVYLYYRFDNRPRWYAMLWKLTDILRRAVSRLPHVIRLSVSQTVAAFCYFPLARTAKFLDSLGKMPAAFPLAYYRNRSFYTMRTDALDRLGTRIEHRFTKAEIETLLERAGFSGITFSESAPYWCAVARKK